ncbi:hypothetical protein LTR85_011655 [Meristemomyces frigidus]|nr:hypothetical protein LTR85_011655 [Meristemomyces frigidus]
MVAAKLSLCLGLVLSASAIAVEKRAACASYVLINARGTGETAGQESSGFKTMNSNVESQVSGGTIYNVNYPAANNQDSSAGTTDIVNHVNSVLSSNPNTCIILEGYSQGAAAVVNAMPKLTGASFTAVKGVVLEGDPEHKSGLACNVDETGGTTTKNVNGLEVSSGSVPSTWVSKTLDICIKGDGVCDTTDGYGITSQHLQYPSSSSVQSMGTKYIVGKLGG